jgi:hypothetical protein
MREQLYWPLQECAARPQMAAVLVNADCAQSFKDFNLEKIQKKFNFDSTCTSYSVCLLIFRSP